MATDRKANSDRFEDFMNNVPYRERNEVLFELLEACITAASNGCPTVTEAAQKFSNKGYEVIVPAQKVVKFWMNVRIPYEEDSYNVYNDIHNRGSAAWVDHPDRTLVSADYQAED